MKFNKENRNRETECLWKGISYSQEENYRIVHIKKYVNGSCSKDYYLADYYPEEDWDWIRIGKYKNRLEACIGCEEHLKSHNKLKINERSGT
jgi:hypothetical protein